MGFWKRVDEELEYLGISRKDLAFKSDTPIATIHKGIERDSEVYVSVAMRISEVLGVTLEYLMDLPDRNEAKEKPHGKKYDTQNVQNQQKTVQETRTAIRLYRKYSKYIANMEKLSTKKLEAIGKVIEMMGE